MSVLILTPFQHPGPAATMTLVDFTSEKAGNDAAMKWATETMKTYGAGSDRYTAVCVPK